MAKKKRAKATRQTQIMGLQIACEFIDDKWRDDVHLRDVPEHLHQDVSDVILQVMHHLMEVCDQLKASPDQIVRVEWTLK